MGHETDAPKPHLKTFETSGQAVCMMTTESITWLTWTLFGALSLHWLARRICQQPRGVSQLGKHSGHFVGDAGSHVFRPRAKDSVRGLNLGTLSRWSKLRSVPALAKTLAWYLRGIMETGCDSGGVHAVGMKHKAQSTGYSVPEIQSRRQRRLTVRCSILLLVGASPPGTGGFCFANNWWLRSRDRHISSPEIFSRNGGGSRDSSQVQRVFDAPGRPLSVRPDEPRPDTKWPSNRRTPQVREQPRLRRCFHL